MYRRKLNRAWEVLRTLPMPATASDHLVDLHDDLMHYDTSISTLVRDYLRGHPINLLLIKVDTELDEALRDFKAETSAETECRRELLRYKRRVDDVVRELRRLIDLPVVARVPV